MKVLVLGFGANGLSCAIKLLKEGHSVTVYSDKRSPFTCSDTSAAIWAPYLLEGNEDEILEFSSNTLSLYREMEKNGKKFIRTKKGYILHRTEIEKAEIPKWADKEMKFTLITTKNDREGVLKKGIYGNYKNPYSYAWECHLPLIDSSYLMKYLEEEFFNLGGQYIQKKVTQIPPGFDVVVNCSGIGSKELLNDNKVYPQRGQIIRVEAPWIDTFFLDVESDPLAYIIPRLDCVILGGTKDKSWNMEIDEKEAKRIFEQCCLIEPSLRKSKIISHQVNLRPTRESLRVEKEYINNQLIIHNYGHGGSGMTLCFGCADRVAKLIQSSKL